MTMLPPLVNLAFAANTSNVASVPRRGCMPTMTPSYREQLPSIFDLLRELSGDDQNYAFPSCPPNNETRDGYTTKSYQSLNTVSALNLALCPQRKRRRTSMDDDYLVRRTCEETDLRYREFMPEFRSLDRSIVPGDSSPRNPSPSPRRRPHSLSDEWIGSPEASPLSNTPMSQPSSFKHPTYASIETRSTSEPHGGFVADSSPNQPPQKAYSDYDGIESFRVKARKLPSLNSLNLRNITTAQPRPDSLDNEYLGGSVPASSSSEYPSGADSKCSSGFREQPHSDHTAATSLSSPSFPKYYPLNAARFQNTNRVNTLMRDNSGMRYGMPVSNHSHFNSDISSSLSESKPRKRRGNLPKQTTDKLRAWFIEHLEHPYPTEDEKQQLMDATGLQMNQISNWYINARRRQLPAMAANARAEEAARNLSRRSPIELTSK